MQLAMFLCLVLLDEKVVHVTLNCQLGQEGENLYSIGMLLNIGILSASFLFLF